jgi:hypothetical protein
MIRGILSSCFKTVPAQATQPVVGVNGVGRAGTSKRRRDRVRELINVEREFVALQRRCRSGRHVMHAKARLYEHRVVHLGIVATGVDVHFVAEARKGARQLADVDVHAPAVARTGLGQGRRVIGENGQTNHLARLPASSQFNEGLFQPISQVWATARSI